MSSQPIPSLSLGDAAVGKVKIMAWGQVNLLGTWSEGHPASPPTVYLYNASGTLVQLTFPLSRLTFQLAPGQHVLTAVDKNEVSVQVTPLAVTQVTGLNSLVGAYFPAGEVVPNIIQGSTSLFGNGASTTINQGIFANVTWSPGALSPQQAFLAPTIPTRVAYLTQLIIFHDTPSVTKDYGIIGKSYSVNLQVALGSILTIAANYERPGTLVIPFATALTMGAVGSSMQCGVVLDNGAVGGAFTYAGGITMIGYEI